MIGVAANAVFVHRTIQIVTRLRRQRTERNFSQSLTAGLVRPHVQYNVCRNLDPSA